MEEAAASSFSAESKDHRRGFTFGRGDPGPHFLIAAVRRGAEENARRWLETAGDGAAARASAFAAGGYLDPSDFAAASSSDSESSGGSSDSDASDSSGEPLFGAVTEPRVEADL